MNSANVSLLRRQRHVKSRSARSRRGATFNRLKTFFSS